MATQLHIYTNNPTKNFSDGTEVSSGTGLSPIAVTLDASKAEKQAVKCSVRCDIGYKIEGTVTIKFIGESNGKWQAARDDNYADPEEALAEADWQECIELENVNEYNTIFWVKASSSVEEVPKNDTGTTLLAEGLVVVS